MRRSALLLVLLSTACAGGYPVKLRPGSNVALPGQGSMVGDVVNSIICDKNKGQRQDAAAQCGLPRPDTLPPRVDTPTPVPPTKRP